MQPEKRKTIELFFRSFKKKTRDRDERDAEPNVSEPTPSGSSNSYSPPDTEVQSMSTASSSMPSSSTTASSSPTSNIQANVIPDDISRSRDESPTQPKLRSYPVNNHKCAFQSIWFKDRPWLEYSVANDSCYCYYCRHFSSNKLTSGDAFVTTGFNNWKRSLESNGGLTKHSSSQSHMVATKNFESFQQRKATNSNVINKLDSSRLIQIRRNRDRLVKICSAVHLLSRQMISFRGHVENEKYVYSPYPRSTVSFLLGA